MSHSKFTHLGNLEACAANLRISVGCHCLYWLSFHGDILHFLFTNAHCDINVWDLGVRVSSLSWFRPNRDTSLLRTCDHDTHTHTHQRPEMNLAVFPVLNFFLSSLYFPSHFSPMADWHFTIFHFPLKGRSSTFLCLHQVQIKCACSFPHHHLSPPSLLGRDLKLNWLAPWERMC